MGVTLRNTATPEAPARAKRRLFSTRARDRIEDLLLEQIPKILEAQCPAERFFAQHVIGHVGLPNLQLTDFVLDRVADQQSIRKDSLCLADSMGAINGLIFDGRIPPWVKKDHVGCRLQIESGPPAFSDIRNTPAPGARRKSMIRSSRFSVFPVSLKSVQPKLLIRSSMRRSISTNWLKTSTLFPSSIRGSSRSTSASSFALVADSSLSPASAG